MYCQECGSKLPENAKFCVNCGTKVWVEEPAEEVKEEKAEDITEAQVDSEAEQVELDVEILKKVIKKTKKVNKKLYVIIASVFCVLAIAVGGLFAYLENRMLYTLVNPEVFFGKCNDYVIFESAPGKSWVELEFESETDFFDDLLKYVDCVEAL